jgi:pimeloyl-ACP methyl ester carboxylesterase
MRGARDARVIWAFVGAGLAILVFIVLAWLALFTRMTLRRVEIVVPPLGTFIDVNGASIHYVDRGEGPTLLLIHGLFGHARHFTHSLVDRLADDFRVVVMDRPGSGYSKRRRGASAGPLADAAVVAGFVHALGLGRPVLVGHSLGGAVSLATALEHPDVVGGLALIAPLTHPVDEVPAVFRPLDISSAALRHAVAWTVATPVSILRGERNLDAVFGPEPVPADFAVRGGGLLTLRPQQFVSASEDLVAARADMPRLLERYGTVDVPVGILFGTGDRILDPELHGQGMPGRVPGLRLELIEGGHMLPLTQPDRVAAFVRALVRDA